MIGGGEIARRYALAIFGLGENPAAHAKLLADLHTLTQEIAASPDLSRVLFQPIFSRGERKAVMHELSGRLELPTEIRAAAEILVDENRAQLLPSIRDQLRALVDAEAGRVEAHVTTARPLDAKAAEQLRQALSRRVNSEVTLVTEVDPTLIGGVVARVGDLLLDGSIRTQLENLGANLRKGSAT
ncbi:MAG: ATP synthase F1 subunit delta [bacterium]